MLAPGSAWPAKFFEFAHDGALPGRVVRPDDAAWAGSIKLPSSAKPTSANAARIPKRPLLFIKSLLLFLCFCCLYYSLCHNFILWQVSVIPYPYGDDHVSFSGQEAHQVLLAY